MARLFGAPETCLLASTELFLSLGSMCDEETTTNVYDMLQNFLKRKLWVPSIAQVCSVFENYGLRAGKLPICDHVAALKSSSTGAAGGPADVAVFVETKTLHLFKLLDTWLQLDTLDYGVVVLLLKLLFTIACGYEWKDTMKLRLASEECIIGLISQVSEKQRAGVIRELTDYCLSLADTLSTRYIIIQHICPVFYCFELRRFMAFKFLEAIYLEQSSEQARTCSQSASDEIPIPPSTKQLYTLVSRLDFPRLISQNGMQKKGTLIGESGYLDLYKVIELIRASTGNPHITCTCTADDEVQNAPTSCLNM